MSGPLNLAAWQLALAASLLLVHAGLSLWLRLDLHRRLGIATLRTVVQLSLLGVVLEPVFAWRRPWLVLLLCLGMILLAARESVRRVSRRYPGIYGHASIALLVGAGGTALLATTLIIDVQPWWTPRYLIPLVGMILGNALTGISLGLDRCLVLLDDERDAIEQRLALGASWWEAGRPVATEAIRTGMIPILNAMSVVGLVTIPGMMTGQILGGTAPGLAARYQMLILFLIAAATALGVAISVLTTLWALFDDQHRLRSERLSRLD